MSANHLETIKQVAQHLETIIEKIDGLEYCPFTWDVYLGWTVQGWWVNIYIITQILL